jgi:hypothetical protein
LAGTEKTGYPRLGREPLTALAGTEKTGYPRLGREPLTALAGTEKTGGLNGHARRFRGLIEEYEGTGVRGVVTTVSR